MSRPWIDVGKPPTLTEAIRRIEPGVGEFLAYEGAKVTLISRGAEWDRLANDARWISAATEVVARGLVGGNRFEAVRLDRIAAAAAFDRIDADQAVVATVDDGLIAVAICRTLEDRLEILAEGATHRADAASSAAAEVAVQHAVARIAARVTLEVRAYAPSDPRQQQAFEARQHALGRLPVALPVAIEPHRRKTETRSRQAVRAWSWSAADTDRVAREVAVVPLPLGTFNAADGVQDRVADMAEFFESGGSVRVIRPATMSEANRKQLGGLLPELTTFIAERDGTPFAILIYAETGRRLLVVQNHLLVVQQDGLARGQSPAFERGAMFLVQHALMCEARRWRLPVQYVRQPSIRWSVAAATAEATFTNQRLGPLADWLHAELFAHQPTEDPAATTAGVDSLESSYPGIKALVLDESGELRRFVGAWTTTTAGSSRV